MKLLLSGASGLIGSALLPFLATGGHEIIRLVRKTPAGAAEICWDPVAGKLAGDALEGMDAVVHLAGDNIASGLWTPEKKARIRNSRVQGTQLLSETLAGLQRPPKVFLSASATGFYGHRGDEILTEDSAAGAGFLAEVCREWEAATEAARQKGIRVGHLRFGIVLARQGGALGRMLPVFKLGLGGRLGDGRQYWPWLVLDDALGVVWHALTHESLHGPMNVVAPQAVTNREFTQTLARVLRRPALFPLPAVLARLLFGEMAGALFFASARVEPRRLLAGGFHFAHPQLEGALRHLLRKG